MDEHAKLARAKQRVEAITGFYIHLGVFIAVMTLLVFVDLLGDADWWAQWPFLGWGVGILAHWWAVFGRTPTVLANWQLRKIKELKDKM